MRLDLALVERGLAATRSKAVHLIRSGEVRVNGEVVRRQSREVGPDDAVELGATFRYVGRGGYKLERLASEAGLVVEGRAVLDVGCSTGGFTDFFLQRGAARVVAVDVADTALHPSLLADPRVEFHGGVDARDATALSRAVGGRAFDIVSVDVSNVPLHEVLVAVAPLVAPGGVVVALFKPPYEGGRGVVSEREALALADAFERYVGDGFEVVARATSPLRGGPKGRGTAEVLYLIRPRDGPPQASRRLT